MTQTTILTKRPPGAATDIAPAGVLMNLIVSLFQPMFLKAAAGDIGMARLTAIATVNAYRARNHADLVAIPQIIAFGLCAVGSLGLSMTDDIPPAMALRLRGNANALNRSAEQNRRVLRENLGDDPPPLQAARAAEAKTPSIAAEDDARTEAEVFLNTAAADSLAAESEARLRDPDPVLGQAHLPVAAPISAPIAIPIAAGACDSAEKRHQAMWAIAMIKEAGEISAGIPDLPAVERRTATLRAAALSSTANELLSNGDTPPFSSRRRGMSGPPDKI
jgi:hypothetical protein